MKTGYLILSLFLLSLSAPAQTPTGVAYAYPMDRLVVDGSLEEWKSVRKYPIAALPYGDVLDSEEDLEAFFQVAHNAAEKALYLAVTITDQENILDEGEDATWNTQDTYNLYLNEGHHPDGSGVILYSLNEVFEYHNDLSASWDPALRERGTAALHPVEKQIGTRGQQKFIELKIGLHEAIISGRHIGFDHMISDVDAGAPYDMVTWTNSGGKSSVANRTGTLIFLDRDSDLITLNGQLAWNTDTLSTYPPQVRVQAEDNLTAWVDAAVDSTGRFTARLPPGRYRLELRDAYVNFGDYWNSTRDKVVCQHGDFTLGGQTTGNVLRFPVALLPRPDLLPSKGLLLDGLSIEDERRVDAFMRAYAAYHNVAGISLALIDGGKVVFSNQYGYRNYATREPLDTRAVFEGASITKPMFAFAVMRLVERGEFDLDRPLYQYHEAPEGVRDDPRHQLITARMVLSHTTGFPNWAYMNPDGKLDIRFTPGTQYGYSGAGFEYLKEAVVKTTGRSIEAVLQEEVLDVFGLENTYFKYEPGLEKTKVHGHYGLNPAAVSIDRTVNTAATVHTDPQSYAQFLLGIAARKGLKPETYAEMLKLHTVTDTEEERREGFDHYFGLGLYFSTSPTFGKSFGHSGNNGDFKCDAMYYEDLQKGFVVMTNSSYGDAVFMPDLYRLLILGDQQLNP